MPESNSEMVGYMQKAIAMAKVAFCAYMEQHEHMELWGYPRAAKLLKKLAKCNAKIIEMLTHQLEFFDIGVGKAEYAEIEWPRKDIQGIIKIDLAMEEEIRTLAGKAKFRGVELGDPVTANRFTKIASKAQKAIEELQAALSVIDETSIKMFRQNLNLD